MHTSHSQGQEIVPREHNLFAPFSPQFLAHRNTTQFCLSGLPPAIPPKTTSECSLCHKKMLRHQA